MSFKLYIYCIHTQHLTNRALRSHGVFIELSKAAKENGFDVTPILIIKNDPADLQNNMEKLQSMVKKDIVNDELFDSYNKNFNIQMISNFEKHKDAWKRIYSLDTNINDNVFHLVIEDDVFIVKESIEYFKKLLNIIKTNSFKWDMLFLGIPSPDNNDDNDNLDLINLNNSSIKIIPSKESYFITQQTARRIYDTFNYYKYILRVQLSYLFFTNPTAYNIYYTNKRITIDGSKVGIFPSSIHETNHLVYNNEYMTLYSYFSKDTSDILQNIDDINDIYKKISVLKNIDFDILYSKILLKINKLDDAKNILLNSLNYYKSSQAIVNNRSELINMIIDISAKTQDDLDNLISLPSKFENLDLSDKN